MRRAIAGAQRAAHQHLILDSQQTLDIASKTAKIAFIIEPGPPPPGLSSFYSDAERALRIRKAEHTRQT